MLFIVETFFRHQKIELRNRGKFVHQTILISKKCLLLSEKSSLSGLQSKGVKKTLYALLLKGDACSARFCQMVAKFGTMLSPNFANFGISGICQIELRLFSRILDFARRRRETFRFRSFSKRGRSFFPTNIL